MFRGEAFVWRVEAREFTGKDGKQVEFAEVEFAEVQDGKRGSFVVLNGLLELVNEYVGEGRYEVGIGLRVRDGKVGHRVLSIVPLFEAASQPGLAAGAAEDDEFPAISVPEVSLDAVMGDSAESGELPRRRR